ncbi:unnamed protein product [Rhizoctonia solani]|nr:unnamed protein product [Rhizoctonia solani]
MLAFSRLASILLFVLSLSFLACAAPTAANSALAVRGDDVGVMCLDTITNLRVKLDAHVEACVSLTTVEAAKVFVDVLVVDVQAAIDVIVKLSLNVLVSVEIKAKIAAELALVIRAIVTICATLVANLGLDIAISLCVMIDAIVKILCLSIDACVSGVLELCAKLLIDLDVHVLLKLHLDLCVKVLGLAHLLVGAVVGIVH